MLRRYVFTSFMCIVLLNTAALAADTSESKGAKGGLDKKVIDEMVKRHVRQVQHCYSKELNSSKPLASGKVNTHFTIGSDGKVTKAEISSTTLKNEKVESCVLEVINRMVFTEPMGGGTVDVHYPFAFAPKADSSAAPKAKKE